MKLGTVDNTIKRKHKVRIDLWKKFHGEKWSPCCMNCSGYSTKEEGGYCKIWDRGILYDIRIHMPEILIDYHTYGYLGDDEETHHKTYCWRWKHDGGNR